MQPLLRGFCPVRAELVAGAVAAAHFVSKFMLLNHEDSCQDGICNVIWTLFLAVHLGVFHFHGQDVRMVSLVVSAVGALNAVPATENMEQAGET